MACACVVLTRSLTMLAQFLYFFVNTINRPDTFRPQQCTESAHLLCRVQLGVGRKAASCRSLV